MYSPTLGRWMEEDDAYWNGMNFYEFEVDTPASATDPFGRDVGVLPWPTGGGTVLPPILWPVTPDPGSVGLIHNSGKSPWNITWENAGGHSAQTRTLHTWLDPSVMGHSCLTAALLAGERQHVLNWAAIQKAIYDKYEATFGPNWNTEGGHIRQANNDVNAALNAILAWTEVQAADAAIAVIKEALNRGYVGVWPACPCTETQADLMNDLTNLQQFREKNLKAQNGKPRPPLVINPR